MAQTYTFEDARDYFKTYAGISSADAENILDSGNFDDFDTAIDKTLTLAEKQTVKQLAPFYPQRTPLLNTIEATAQWTSDGSTKAFSLPDNFFTPISGSVEYTSGSFCPIILVDSTKIPQIQRDPYRQAGTASNKFSQAFAYIANGNLNFVVAPASEADPLLNNIKLIHIKVPTAVTGTGSSDLHEMLLDQTTYNALIRYNTLPNEDLRTEIAKIDQDKIEEVKGNSIRLLGFNPYSEG